MADRTPTPCRCQYRVQDGREINVTRRYQMRVRAERHADTRRRILAAAADLQRNFGPQGTTISEVARLAGVERPTVVRHFRDRITLFMACTLGDPIPGVANVSVWQHGPNPEIRLLRGLSEQFAWYRRNRALATYLFDTVETDDSLAHWREVMWRSRTHAEEVLAQGWQVSDSARPRLLLAIHHALSFWSWCSLAEYGLTDDEAASLLVDMVRGVASNQIWKAWSGNLDSLAHYREG